jgi:REP element-mobilizing transposase RayT
MPEHIHLLISEPRRDTIPIVVQVLKQRVARRLLPPRKVDAQRELWEPASRQRFWQRRYYDFNVYSDGKVTETLCTFTGTQWKEDWFPRLSCGAGVATGHSPAWKKGP